MSCIIFLSGPVGAGKTTVGRELAKSSAGPTAYIEGDKFWSFIAKPPKDDVKGGQRFRTIMRSMTLSALPFARAGFETIVDFSIPPQFLEYARAAAKEIPLHFVALLPSSEVCATRAASRLEGAITDYTKYLELYSFFDPNSPQTVNDHDSDPVTLTARIRRELAEGRFSVS